MAFILGGILSICLTVCYIADRYFTYKENVEKGNKKDEQ